MNKTFAEQFASIGDVYRENGLDLVTDVITDALHYLKDNGIDDPVHAVFGCLRQAVSHYRFERGE